MAAAYDLQPTAAADPSGSMTKDEELREAASNGDVAQVHLLLASGANPDAADAEGWSSLHWACAHAAVASVLIDAGASVDAADRHGKTTLHWWVPLHAYPAATHLALLSDILSCVGLRMHAALLTPPMPERFF